VGAIKTYRDLLIWQKGIGLVKEVYQRTGAFPSHELFGLTSQMRRAAVSFPSNVAEGQARRHTKEFVQYLYQALGSLAELETQVIIAGELGYVSAEEVERLTDLIMELHRMTGRLVTRLTNRP